MVYVLVKKINMRITEGVGVLKTQFEKNKLKGFVAPGVDPGEGTWGKFLLPNPKFSRKNFKFRKKNV